MRVSLVMGVVAGLAAGVARLETRGARGAQCSGKKNVGVMGHLRDGAGKIIVLMLPQKRCLGNKRRKQLAARVLRNRKCKPEHAVESSSPLHGGTFTAANY